MNPKQVAVITGGSRGIGAATAIEFARCGYDVALAARDAAALATVALEVERIGRSAAVFVGDLADLGFARSIVDGVRDRWGRLDVLVNNAAWREWMTMREISLASWERTMRVCLTTPAFLAQWAGSTMEEAGAGGVIINVSSCMSRRGAGLSPAYTAAKGGLDSLTYDLASLYGPSGIRVIGVNPGAIDTEMSRDVVANEPENDDSVSREVRRYSEDMIMLGRWGRADEIARLIVALCGDAGSYVTGTTVLADGGWSHNHFPASLKKRIAPSSVANRAPGNPGE